MPTSQTAVAHAQTPPLHRVDYDGLDAAMSSAADFLLDPRIGFPVLPAAVAEVMKLANSSEANFREVDQVVRHDPIVAARVLSVANSPLYRPPSPITSLRVAMMRLGWSVLRDILMQAVAEAHLFRHGPRRELATARLHAVVVAHVHRHVAQVVGFDPEHAFVCGLLHDLGRPLMLGLLARADAPTLNPLQRASLIESLHHAIGGRVAQAWGLPDVVVRVCREHHECEADPASSTSGVSTIAVCEALIMTLGFASDPQPSPEASEVQLERLGLAPHEVESLRSTVEILCREAA